MNDAPTAWMIRAGRNGEHEAAFLEHGFAGTGFGEVPDLTGATARDQVKALVRSAYPGAKDGAVANYAGQLWALRSRISPGDLVVLPFKRSPQIALGVVTQGYWFAGDDDSGARHCVAVDWRRTDVPRTAVRQDLLYSLGAFLTVCQIKRNDGAWRLQQILETGNDPGARVETVGEVEQVHEIQRDRQPVERVETIDTDVPDAADSLDTSFDIERFARDRVQAHVAEHFAGHRLADLVAAVLEAEGFFTEVAPPGPDGGIDVFAGRGPLGLDPPKLIVQVKSSPSPVAATVVRELHGVLSTHGAEQALLVAWGGVNRVAQRELRSQFFRVRVWDADNLLDAILRNYDQLDEEWRTELPLKRIWSLATEPDE